MKRLLVTALIALLPAAAMAQPSGAALFAQHCAVCHAAGGEGTPGMAPRLAGTLGARAATEPGRAYLAQVLMNGLAGPITVAGERFNLAMPGFAQLGDAEILVLLDFVAIQLNGSSTPVEATAVATARQQKLAPNAVRKLRGP